MEHLRYSDFSLQIHQRTVKERIPANGSIEVTRRCPLACVHCYNNLPMDDAQSRRRELTREEHYRILDETAEAGCLWLLYTGGEPFARPDFLDIYTRAKRRGFLITLFTNGMFLTPEVVDCLAEWRPFSIEITVYGRTRETYESVTGVAGSFDRCMKAVRLLLDRRLPLKLKTMAITHNKHELWDLKRFAEEELGVEFRFDAMINCRLDCSQRPAAVRLTPHEIVELDVRDARRLAEWRKFAERFGGPIQPEDGEHRLYHCGAGVSTFGVDPSGRLTICGLAHGDAYDLRNGSFHEGWEFLRAVRQKRITRRTKCLGCEIKAICGMCPANGEFETGNPEKPVDFLCRVAHLRAYVFGLEAPEHGECEYCEGGKGYEDLRRSAAALRNTHLAGTGQAVERAYTK